MRVRPRVQGILQPIGRFLARVGISPTFMTLFGFVISTAGAIVIGLGHLVVGAVIFLVGSALDGLDGAVARASNRVTARGAFLDATVDRLGEIAMLTGLAVSQRGQGRILLLALLSMGAALMIPYMRAKAEAEGLDGKGGLMGRAERVILFSIGLMTGFIEPMLWLMLAGNWYTVGQRFWSTYRRIDS
jgi:CDP-diacylglycerol---glycerol-3-phosphate 3-phosphatidyltransferase